MNRSHLARAILISAVLLPAFMLASPTEAEAQAIFRQMHAAQPGRFIAAPRSIQQQLREAERALEEERNSDAVVRLGDLLSSENEAMEDLDLSGQDFFIEIDEARDAGIPVSKSLLRVARKMIGDLPPAAIETYELRYGPLARRLLNEAAAARNWDQVRDVRRKYFHTYAGYEASALLAQNAMLKGHPLEASLLLDEVVTSQRAIEHLGASVRLMHLSALSLSGRELPTEVELKGSVPVNGKEESWPSAEELPQWIEDRATRLGAFTPAERTDYSVFGADSHRNGNAAGQMPLTNLRWMLDTTASPRQERAVRKIAEDLTTGAKLPPPSWIPLRVGNQLLMRTTERLVGVDYRTGKRVWTYPWHPNTELFDEDESAFDTISNEGGQGDLLTQRVWNDVPYGQITSDGQRVYILDDLREVEMTSFSPMINLRGTRPADTGTNTLVALDLNTEGKLLWRLGASADEVSTLSEAFFLGPPLPLDGRLYVMVELAGDINLCCLDATSGAEIWRQHLVAVESGGIDSDPIRRVSGAMPTYDEGILICPTGAGAIVGVDLADRVLRWGVTYDRNSEMIRSVASRRAMESNQLMQRWFSSIAVAAENSVVVTPIEADRLFGFDLLTGESLFTEKNRVHMKYLAGIRDGRFFVVGTNQVRAFDLKSGESIWTTPRDMLPAGQQISGYGVFGNDDFFVPTTANQIIRISLSDGEVTGRRTTRYPLGNLVAAGGEVIAQGPTSLSVAFGEATLEPIVNRMLEENPDDFEAIVRKSELLIQNDMRDEALKLLARAREMQPDNDEVRMLSVSAMLGKLQKDLDVDSSLIETLDELIDRPSQRVELLALRIRAALASRDHKEATRRLIDLSSLIAKEPLLESASDQVVNDTSRQASLDSWLAARVRELVSGLSEEEQAEVSEMVREVNEPRFQGSTNLIKRLVRHFGAVDGIEPMRLELADRLRADEAHLELERLALGTQIPSALGLKRLSSQRLEMLVDAYASGGMPKDTLRVLNELESRDDAVDGDRFKAIRDVASTRIKKPYWPENVSLKWDSRRARIRPLTSTQRVGRTQFLAGQQFVGWKLISERTSPLAMRDPTGMLRRIPMEGQADDSDKESQVSGGVMVVIMPNGLLGVDLYHLLASDGEAVMWRRGLSGDSGPVATRRTTMTPFDDQIVVHYIRSSNAGSVIPEFKLGPAMGDRILLLQGGDLLAIDLLTAETLWRNSTAPKSGAVLSDGERVAVVSSKTNEIVYFDLMDGERLDTEVWDHGEIWAAIGTNVLCYRDTGDRRRYELSLVDAFTGEKVLRQETFAANRTSQTENIPAGYGRVIAGRYMVHLENSGKTIVWDLMEGREIGSPELPAYPTLVGMRAMMLDGQLIVLPKLKINRQQMQNTQLQTTAGATHDTAHGVHAIALDDGSLRWSQQFERPWGCTLTQPSETPILLLTRSPSVFSTTNTSRRKRMEVLALSVQDGAVMDEDSKEIHSSNNELATRVTVQPGLSRVIAHVGPELLTYTFGEEEPVPEVEPELEPEVEP